MRRKKTTGTWVYQAATPFTLYLDDVQDMYAAVASVSTTVGIETDEYADIKSVEELASTSPHGTRRVSGFHMIGSKRGTARIRVTVNGKGGMVVLVDDSPDLIGAQEKVKRIMWRHSDFMTLKSTWPIYSLVLVVAALFFGASRQVVTLVPVVVAALLLALLGWHLGRSRFASVYLVDKSEAPGLLRRNRDILVMLVGTALGLLASALFPVIRDSLR